MCTPDEVVRFESHVDRCSGDHHIWLGSRNPQRGTGKLKVGGKQVTAHRRAWELANGPVPPGSVVRPCPDQPLCVRVEHLRLAKGSSSTRPSARRGSRRVQVQVNGVRVHRRVRGGRADVESTKALIREQLQQAVPQDQDATRWALDDLLERYIAYLDDQGREVRTRLRYAEANKNWISPLIGGKPARRLSADDIDRCFARMRKAGQSTSSMNQAKALLSGAFKWARRTGKVLHNPMLGFQLPKSTYVPKEKLPPEAADISMILSAALEHTPDIAPVLTLAATTGARLGELLALRVPDIDWDRRSVWVRAATDVDGSLKSPKRSQHRRQVPVDECTLDILRRQAEEMADRAAVIGVPLAPEPFLFSDEPDCSAPLRPGVVTRRLGVLKGHLGAEDKRPTTIALEDEALRLRRFGKVDRSGRPGPRPMDGAAMSYDDVAKCSRS